MWLAILIVLFIAGIVRNVYDYRKNRFDLIRNKEFKAHIKRITTRRGR